MDDKLLNAAPIPTAEGELPLKVSSPAFLSGGAIWNEIKGSLAGAKKVDLAVAYWGNGILAQIADASWAAPTRIVCDVMSGFCHVDTIRKFIERKDLVQVKMLRRLHAKVYLTDTSAVIGSANASAAALGTGAHPNFEAAVRIVDPSTLLGMRQWFEWLWETADDISPDHLEAAEEVAKAAAKAAKEVDASKPQEPSSREKSFLEKLSQRAYAEIMNRARTNSQVTHVRFGTLGEGERPNFVFIFSDGSERSYYYPGEGSELVSAPDFSKKHTTSPIPVVR